MKYRVRVKIMITSSHNNRIRIKHSSNHSSSSSNNNRIFIKKMVSFSFFFFTFISTNKKNRSKVCVCVCVCHPPACLLYFCFVRRKLDKSSKIRIFLFLLNKLHTFVCLSVVYIFVVCMSIFISTTHKKWHTTQQKQQQQCILYFFFWKCTKILCIFTHMMARGDTNIIYYWYIVVGEC